jgi:hypothetical protein
MHIAFALRRERDEIAATIAAYAARIDVARADLAALERAARLFDAEAECDGTTFRVSVAQLAPPADRAQAPYSQDAGLFESIGGEEPPFAGRVARSARRPARGQIPEEFFYLDWR